jgi:hypothetical protein
MLAVLRTVPDHGTPSMRAVIVPRVDVLDEPDPEKAGVALAVTPRYEAVMITDPVAAPGVMAVTSPEVETTSTLGFEELQVVEAVTFWVVPSANSAVAESWSVWPANEIGFAPVIESAETEAVGLVVVGLFESLHAGIASRRAIAQSRLNTGDVLFAGVVQRSLCLTSQTTQNQ